MTMLHLHGCACPGCQDVPAADQRSGERSGARHAPVPEVPGADGATKPVYDSDAVIAALTRMGGNYASVAWNGSAVTYSIGTGKLAYGHPEWSKEHDGYAAMSAAMEQAAAEAFGLWDDLIDIELVERSNDPYADVTFNYSAATNNATYTRYSYYLNGGRADHTMADADIWFATGWPTHDEDSDLYQGGYGVFSYLHEIGHSLGLSHPGPYNGSASYAADAEYFQDSRAYTVMSYFDADQNGSGADHTGGLGRRYGSTPLLHDILAIQAIYGADQTTRTGPTTYGFGSTAGRAAFDFTVNLYPVVAIWDAGGIDTVDLSGWSMKQRVDLNEGAFSSVGGMTQNLAIAWGAVIENAVGGGGDDVLVGNAVANVLRGGAGDDALYGYEGDDVLWGGPGGDTLDGGAGTDWVRYDAAGGAATVDLAGGIGAGQAGGDTYAGIENASGSDDADLLIGDAAANRLEGLAGDDTLLGGDGDDMLYGGDGDDSLDGGAGADVLEGGAGRDLLYGGANSDTASYRSAGGPVYVNLTTGNGALGDALGDRLASIENLDGSAYADTLVGNGSANRLGGGDGDDFLTGQGGNDWLEGGPGADRLKGDGGSDWAVYTASAAAVTVDLATGRGTGGEAEGDTYRGMENVAGSAAGDVLIGSSAANRLEGNDGDDTLSGGAGADTLVGGDGDDVITGGRGTDTLDGGAGDDLFVFAAGDGSDRIEGFELARDMISIIAATTAFEQLAVTGTSLGASIGYGDGDTILLVGIGAGEVGADAFTFG